MIIIRIIMIVMMMMMMMVMMMMMMVMMVMMMMMMMICLLFHHYHHHHHRHHHRHRHHRHHRHPYCIKKTLLWGRHMFRHTQKFLLIAGCYAWKICCTNSRGHSCGQEVLCSAHVVSLEWWQGEPFPGEGSFWVSELLWSIYTDFMRFLHELVVSFLNKHGAELTQWLWQWAWLKIIALPKNWSQ